jgi:hypothetical protein
MALKNKLDETKLRSLTYGDNSPYVTVDINNQDVIAGKKLPVKNNGNRLNHAIIDSARISSFLKDKPFWSLKQTGLQFMNAKPNFSYINGSKNILPSSNQLYTSLNTEAQVALTGIGAHITRQGLTPGNVISFLNNTDTYENIKKQENVYTENPLYVFSDKLIKLKEIDTKSKKTVFGQILSNIVSLFQNPNEPIYSYLGGPKSLLGVGTTTIRRYYNSLDEINKSNLRNFILVPLNKTNKDVLPIEGGTKINYPSTLGVTNKTILLLGDYDNIGLPITEPTQTPAYLNQIGSYENQKTGSLRPSTPNNPILWNIFKTGSVVNKTNINKQTINTEGTNSISYTNDNTGATVTVKSRGNSWYGLSREVRVTSGRTDGINLTPLFSFGSGSINDSILIENKTYNINDLAKFRIEAIDTDSPTNSVFMVFRAYITNFSDDINAEWKAFKYLGRGENFYTYGGHDRSVSVSFKVAALSVGEMIPMYQKLNYLQSNMMGDYNSDGIMRGPFMKMTIGNWFDRQPGILTTLNYKISDDTPWEIAIDEPIGGKKLLVLPHIVDVSLSFIPIGTQDKTRNLLPQKGANQSNFAQNYNGDSNGESNYITGSISAGSNSDKSILEAINIYKSESI